MSAKQPTKRLYIDFMVPCPQTKLGNTVIFVCLDQFTNFVWLEPMRKASTGEVARFLEKNIFYQFAVPELMHSDNGKQFVSQVFAELLTQCGIRHIRSSFCAPSWRQRLSQLHKEGTCKPTALKLICKLNGLS